MWSQSHAKKKKVKTKFEKYFFLNTINRTDCSYCSRRSRHYKTDFLPNYYLYDHEIFSVHTQTRTKHSRQSCLSFLACWIRSELTPQYGSFLSCPQSCGLNAGLQQRGRGEFTQTEQGRWASTYPHHLFNSHRVRIWDEDVGEDSCFILSPISISISWQRSTYTLT